MSRYLENDDLVKLHSVTTAAIANVAQALNADSVRRVGGPSGPLVFHSPSQNATQLMMSLTGRTDLDYAEPDYLVKSAAAPNDPDFGSFGD